MHPSLTPSPFSPLLRQHLHYFYHVAPLSPLTISTTITSITMPFPPYSNYIHRCHQHYPCTYVSIDHICTESHQFIYLFLPPPLNPSLIHPPHIHPFYDVSTTIFPTIKNTTLFFYLQLHVHLNPCTTIPVSILCTLILSPPSL